MGILAVLKWTERLGARRDCTKDGLVLVFLSTLVGTVGSLKKPCSLFASVKRESLSRNTESRLVIGQSATAHLNELKFVCVFVFFRERAGTPNHRVAFLRGCPARALFPHRFRFRSGL